LQDKNSSSIFRGYSRLVNSLGVESDFQNHARNPDELVDFFHCHIAVLARSCVCGFVLCVLVVSEFEVISHARSAFLVT
jgi:hypothetical protein